ncbi:hypothetical protein B0J11DRAFT_439602 [Dendryphion nanum]|uniref:Uncharacterized protein n=1 Tax=Dendryphion nanum TaxID=256645 RepID=A0A9P9DIX1_9PLEO|nr:hypothetical protein B0J11DRAFT_439602 [Dendryphion nanum]
MRSSFVGFWKATAMFQFGVCAVFLAPILLHNENQPDQDVRFWQAVGVAAAGAIPMALMSYLTTPFVKRIAMEIPPWAQNSRPLLQRFATNLPPETRLEFTTLRAFPIERTTTVLAHELRALPSQRFRFANLERVRTQAQKERWAKMNLYRKGLEIVNEPRWKFYVKEGRSYTVPTGVPGVWEEIARVIQMRTQNEKNDGKDDGMKWERRAGREDAKRRAATVSTVETKKPTPLRRQTARSTK